jgi:hypothetical protein
MALNHDLGELIQGLPGPYRVVPLHKWQDTQLWEQAAEMAGKAFKRSGSLRKRVQFTDVLVQEYPKTSKLLFLFEATVAGQPMYYPWVWDLTPEMIAEFTTTGKWVPGITEH